MANKQLQIVVADGDDGAVDRITQTVAGLGHKVIAHAAGLATLPNVSAAEHPDVAIVIIQENSRTSLKMIESVVREAACPVIALLDVQDREFINQAAAQGVFACITGDENASELQNSIDIVLRRFAEYHDLEGAFGRRAVTERAKGILMERHKIDEQAAFRLLRDEARRTQRKVIDIAGAILTSHALLPRHETPKSEIT